jgi:hypothetical protein
MNHRSRLPPSPLMSVPIIHLLSYCSLGIMILLMRLMLLLSVLCLFLMCLCRYPRIPAPCMALDCFTKTLLRPPLHVRHLTSRILRLTFPWLNHQLRAMWWRPLQCQYPARLLLHLHLHMGHADLLQDWCQNRSAPTT